VNSRRSVFCFGPLDLSAQDEVASALRTATPKYEFVYDCLRWQLARLNLAEHRRMVRQHFSGTLCVDELHLGVSTLLLATDPLADLPVGFALVGANDKDHMRRFLVNLARWGLRPEVVVSDGSNLYPELIAGESGSGSCVGWCCCWMSVGNTQRKRMRWR
jgi:hypothetical protein